MGMELRESASYQKRENDGVEEKREGLVERIGWKEEERDKERRVGGGEGGGERGND